MASHAEPRPAQRERLAGVPHVDIVHSAAAEQLVITVHVDVPSDYVLPDGFKEFVASAIDTLAFWDVQGRGRLGSEIPAGKEDQ